MSGNDVTPQDKLTEMIETMPVEVAEKMLQAAGIQAVMWGLAWPSWTNIPLQTRRRCAGLLLLHWARPEITPPTRELLGSLIEIHAGATS